MLRDQRLDLGAGLLPVRLRLDDLVGLRELLVGVGVSLVRPDLADARLGLLGGRRPGMLVPHLPILGDHSPRRRRWSSSCDVPTARPRTARCCRRSPLRPRGAGPGRPAADRARVAAGRGWTVRAAWAARATEGATEPAVSVGVVDDFFLAPSSPVEPRAMIATIGADDEEHREEQRAARGGRRAAGRDVGPAPSPPPSQRGLLLHAPRRRSRRSHSTTCAAVGRPDGALQRERADQVGHLAGQSRTLGLRAQRLAPHVALQDRRDVLSGVRRLAGQQVVERDAQAVDVALASWSRPTRRSRAP